MARNLDKHSGLNYTPASGLSPLLPLQDANWSPWAGNQPAPFPSLPNSNRLPRITISSPESTLQPARQSIAASSTGPILTIPTIPTVATLQPNVPNIHDPTFDPALKVAWVRDVLSLVERTVKTPEPPVPAVIRDFALLRLAQVAIKTLLQIANSETQPLPPYVVEAIFLRGKLTWHGTHPKQVPLNPRAAVRDFKTAAKAGYAPAWFFRGIYYENIKMASRALQCFKRGMELGDAMSMFHMGMAYLFKFASPSLGLQADPVAALPLLHRVATVATVATPQHAFIFGRLLLSKLPPDEIRAPLPSNALAHFVPAGSTVVLEGWKYMERAAHLGHELSQFLVGEAYRTAQPPFLVQDPLLSIHYYSLASQQGKMEADMGLSIWFLHGSPGEDGLEKDPVLAFMFAKKAAKKGLPMAELTMGFCAEEGIGCPKSLQTTIEWYKKAKEHGNSVAAERLNALSQSSPNAL